MLIKKELATIPLLPVPKISKKDAEGAYIVAAAEKVHLPRSGDVLVVDFYERKSKTLKLRFFSDGKTFQCCSEWPAVTWTQRNPRKVLGLSYAKGSDRDNKLVDDFLKTERHSYYSWGVLRIVDSFASEYMNRAHERAMENEIALRNAHFAMYSPYPKNLEAYCDAQVFGHGYIFIAPLDKAGEHQAWCSHCKKHFSVERSARSGQTTVCPKCGNFSIYRGTWIKQNIENKAKLCIAEKVDGQLLLRWLNVYRSYEWPEFKCRYGFDDYAYNLHLTTDRGNKLYFYKWLKGPYQYGYDWYRGKIGDFCIDRSFVYTDNLNEVFGESYYNVNLKAVLEGKLIELPFHLLLNNLKNNPAAEYLFKMNMPLLAAKADIVTWGREDIKPGFTSVLGVSKQMQELYRTMNPTLAEHRVIKAYGGWVSCEDLSAYRSLNIPPAEDNVVIEILQNMTFQKFINYFRRQKAVLTKSKIAHLLVQYRDYIDMSIGLGVDLTRKSVRYPRNCVEAHDQILPRFNAVKHEAEDRIFAEKVAGLYANFRITQYEKDGLCVVLPLLRSDLITEGQSLNHCVGGDRYYKNHIDGTSMIFFIRRADEPQKPYFTMELDMETYHIRQLYGFGNCSAPAPIRKFAEGFVRKLKPADAERRTA